MGQESFGIGRSNVGMVSMGPSVRCGIRFLKGIAVVVGDMRSSSLTRCPAWEAVLPTSSTIERKLALERLHFVRK